LLPKSRREPRVAEASGPRRTLPPPKNPDYRTSVDRSAERGTLHILRPLLNPLQGSIGEDAAKVNRAVSCHVLEVRSQNRLTLVEDRVACGGPDKGLTVVVVMRQIRLKSAIRGGAHSQRGRGGRVGW